MLMLMLILALGVLNVTPDLLRERAETWLEGTDGSWNVEDLSARHYFDSMRGAHRR